MLLLNINAQIIFFSVKKLIAITIVFHISCQCAILSAITLNIAVNGSNYNRLLRHFIPWWFLININAQMILFALHKLIAIRLYFTYHTYVLLSVITLNITIHGSNYDRLLRYFTSWSLLMKNINAQIIFFALQKLIEITSNVPLCQHTSNVLLCQKWL